MKVITYIQNHFKDETFIPPFLDINYQDDIFGENCAMIAVRNGNYVMIKFLKEICNADFHLRNYNNEGIFQIAARSINSNPKKDYLEIFRYLINVVNCDITDDYEQTLALIKDQKILNYVRRQIRRVMRERKQESEQGSFWNELDDATSDDENLTSSKRFDEIENDSILGISI